MQHLLASLSPYAPYLVSLVVLPVVGALVNWALWWDTPAHWDAFAAKYPARAGVIRVLRAVFPHLRKIVATWRDAQTARYARTLPPSQSGRASISALMIFALSLPMLGAHCPPPAPSDGGTANPSAWADTVRVVLSTLAWALPAARGIVDALVPAAAQPVVDRAFAAVADAAVHLRIALDAYLARGGDRCAAYAAVGLCTTALVGLAQTLTDNGIALGSTLIPVVQSLGAVTDSLVPACQSDAGFASAGDSINVRLRAIETGAMSRGIVLRPALDNLHPVTP